MAARERRVYRLAALLTGSPEAAVAVLEAVVAAQPDLARPDRTRLDRLTVLRSREAAAAPRSQDTVAGALAGLVGQQREAWVLSRVHRLPLRRVARAMDCSVTATRRHLERARAALADPDGAARSLQAWAASLEVPAVYRARLRRRQRRRRAALAVALLAAAAALLLLGRLAAG